MDFKKMNERIEQSIENNITTLLWVFFAFVWVAGIKLWGDIVILLNISNTVDSGSFILGLLMGVFLVFVIQMMSSLRVRGF
jgi:hypothetical protein